MPENGFFSDDPIRAIRKLRAAAATGMPRENLPVDDEIQDLECRCEILNDPDGEDGAGIGSALSGIAVHALDIMSISLDLRPTVRFAQSISYRSIPGFTEALGYIREMLEDHWGEMRPLIVNNETGPDIGPRANLLRRLADPVTTIRFLQDAPILTSPEFGPISLRTIEVAAGRRSLRAEDKALSRDDVASAFAAADREQVITAMSAVTEGIEHAAAIRDKLSRILAATGSREADVGLDPLLDLLARLRAAVSEQAQDGRTEPVSAPTPGEVNLPCETRHPPPPPGDIRSRADVLSLLDRINRYYAIHEPSSPVPLLLERAKRIAGMNFIDILKDMAPLGLPEATTILAPDEGADTQ